MSRRTLSRYLGLTFGGHVLAFALGLALILALFDAIEIMRILGKSGAVDAPTTLALTFLKAPQNIMTLAPFVVLFAALSSLAMLAKRQEITVMRVAGASVWQVLTPFLMVAFLYTIFLVAAINPLAATAKRHYDQAESQAIRGNQAMLTLMGQGLWVRQALDQGDSYQLIHARMVKIPEWRLDDVMILTFGPDHQLTERIDAGTAHLTQGAWILDNIAPTGGTRQIPTTLTPQTLEDRFLSAETISVWALPSFIRLVGSTGLPTLGLQVHFGSLLALPFLCAALVMIAAVIVWRPTRGLAMGSLIVAGIMVGFVVFFMTNFLQALGGAGQIPVWLAALSPAFLAAAAGSVALLQIEDR